MSTVTCVKAGTCQGTPGLVCWDFSPHVELPSGAGVSILRYFSRTLLIIYSHFYKKLGPFYKKLKSDKICN